MNDNYEVDDDFFFFFIFHSLFSLGNGEVKTLRNPFTLLNKIKLTGGCQGMGTPTSPPPPKLNLQDSCIPSIECLPCPCRQSHLTSPRSAWQPLEGTREEESGRGDEDQVL